MPTVIEKPDPAPSSASRVDEQLAEATSRIRGHDLALGGLLVAGIVLGYAAAMMLLDRYLVLPEWLRQLSLVAFVGGVGFAAYRKLVRPLRARVNPLYAAVMVEKTIDDAKNSVVGYVEAQERGDVHPAVKAAMGARAATVVDDADVNRAVDHRGLVYAGGVVIALFLVLVALFFVFRPAQFQSLLGRAFAPFSSGVIASRTTVTLTEPQEGDVTVTSGQSITVKVVVSGRVPKPDAADKVRLLVRYNPADAAYDELPMEPGETSREWLVQVRPEQLRTGAWYKVAAGDGETPEYRVTVRTAPLFTDFEVEYEFPAYTRRPAEKTTDPHLMAIRNTKVSVVAKANRAVRDGRAAFEPAGQPVVNGKAVPSRPDALRFDMLLTTPGSYKLTFTAADGERSPDSLPFGIRLDDDRPPQLLIRVPEPDDIQLPANGLLSVDGAAGDDYGLDKLTLKLKLADAAARPLADQPYNGGKSFRRDADGTYPQSLEYKGSVELGKLKDPAGGAVELKEGMVLEYWLEATDNRTKPGSAGHEPDPQVGKSVVKRVRLLPPLAPPEQKDQDARRDQRKQDEKQHADNQQKQLDNEPRPQPNAPPKNPPEPKDNAPQNGMGDPMPMPNNGMPKQQDMGGTTDPKMPPNGMNDGNPMPKDGKGPQGMPMNMNDQGMPGGMAQDMTGNKGENPQQAPMPSPAGSKDTQEKANQVQEQIEKEKQGGGSPKAAPTANDQERTNPANQKTEPPTGGMPPESPPKAGDGGMGASETRQKGMDEPPPEPSKTKAGTGGDMPPMPNKGGNQEPSEPRSEPLGGQPGGERDAPKGDPMMQKGMSPMGKTDPKGGGEPKPGAQQKEGDPMGMGSPQPDNPARAKTAPPSNDRGGERDTPPNPKAGPQPQDGGDPKAQRAEEPGQVRPMSKDGGPMPMNGMGNDAKAADPTANAAEPRAAPNPTPKAGDPKMGDPTMNKGTQGDPKAGPPMGTEAKGGMPQSKDVEPGGERGEPGQAQPMGGRPEAPMPKSKEGKAGPEAGPMDPMTKAGNDPTGMGKGTPPTPDAKQKADLEQAAKDLTSPDPAKQKDARDRIDQALGKGAGQKMQDLAKGLNSSDPMEKARAQQELDDLRRQAEKMGAKEPGAKDGPPMPSPMDMGKTNPGKGTPPDAKQKADLEQAAKDLTSPDPAKQKDARDRIDQALGKGAGQKMQDLAKGLNSSDPMEKARAQQELDDLRRQAEKMGAKEPGAKDGPPMPSPMDMGKTKGGGPKDDTNPKSGSTPKFDPKELEGALNDLNSKDDAKRDAARDKLDKTVGKEARQQAEQLQNDLKSGDPEREARARDQLNQLKQQAEKMAKNNPPEGKGKGKDDRFNQGGTVDPNNAKAMDADPRNRAKSAQLTLDQFERNRYNRDLQDRLGWTQEQYDRFLDDYRREVARLERDAADADRNPPMPRAGPPPPPTDINAGGRIGGTATGPGTAGVGGPTFSAPGFEDAMRRFREGATQRPPAKRP